MLRPRISNRDLGRSGPAEVVTTRSDGPAEADTTGREKRQARSAAGLAGRRRRLLAGAVATCGLLALALTQGRALAAGAYRNLAARDWLHNLAGSQQAAAQATGTTPPEQLADKTQAPQVTGTIQAAQLAAAVRWGTAASQSDPTNCANWWYLAQAAAQAHSPQAEEAWRQFVQSYWGSSAHCGRSGPASAAFWLASASLFRQQQDWAKASWADQWATYLSPENARETIVRTSYLEARYQESLASTAAGAGAKADRSMAAYYRYWQGLPCPAADLAAPPEDGNDSRAVAEDGLALVARAACAEQANRPDVAGRLYAQALQAGPADPELLFRAARFARLQQDGTLRGVLDSAQALPDVRLAADLGQGWQLAGFSVPRQALENDQMLPIYLFWSQAPREAVQGGQVEKAGQLWLEQRWTANLLPSGKLAMSTDEQPSNGRVYGPAYSGQASDWRWLPRTDGEAGWEVEVGAKPGQGTPGLASARISVQPGHTYLMAGRLRGQAGGRAIAGCQWQGQDLARASDFPYLVSGAVDAEGRGVARLTRPPVGTTACRFVILNAAPGAAIYAGGLLLADISRGME